MTKTKITRIVGEYRLIFNEEYNTFVVQQEQMRQGMLNDFASTKGDNVLERKLFDLPATLHSMLVEKLNKEETERENALKEMKQLFKERERNDGFLPPDKIARLIKTFIKKLTPHMIPEGHEELYLG